ncbi:hypothetical protein [Wenjunlia vitaminophila]|uniref:hypothetical protein n=1 Tax=Wenjunlia vitaminophila TaxID=76728 RepID=UPI000371C3D4|nr:hypothetical protein [Wenjunlia vitaminophila]
MDLFASFMRTVVPIVVGLLLGLAARAGFDLDGETATAAVTAALTAAYYAVFRLLEEAAGRIGWDWLRKLAGVLLGWARPPRYPRAAGATPTPTPTPTPAEAEGTGS